MKLIVLYYTCIAIVISLYVMSHVGILTGNIYLMMSGIVGSVIGCIMMWFLNFYLRE